MFYTFQALTEDVNRQLERERELQKKYGELQEKIRDQMEDLQIASGSSTVVNGDT